MYLTTGERLTMLNNAVIWALQQNVSQIQLEKVQDYAYIIDRLIFSLNSGIIKVLEQYKSNEMLLNFDKETIIYFTGSITMYSEVSSMLCSILPECSDDIKEYLIRYQVKRQFTNNMKNKGFYVVLGDGLIPVKGLILSNKALIGNCKEIPNYASIETSVKQNQKVYSIYCELSQTNQEVVLSEKTYKMCEKDFYQEIITQKLERKQPLGKYSYIIKNCAEGHIYGTPVTINIDGQTVKTMNNNKAWRAMDYCEFVSNKLGNLKAEDVHRIAVDYMRDFEMQAEFLGCINSKINAAYKLAVKARELGKNCLIIVGNATQGKKLLKKFDNTKQVYTRTEQGTLNYVNKKLMELSERTINDYYGNAVFVSSTDFPRLYAPISNKMVVIERGSKISEVESKRLILEGIKNRLIPITITKPLMVSDFSVLLKNFDVIITTVFKMGHANVKGKPSMFKLDEFINYTQTNIISPEVYVLYTDGEQVNSTYENLFL